MIVSVALVPASQQFSVLRALRILRALRLLSVVPSMRKVVVGLFSAIPSIGTVILMLVLLFYISAVMATKLFGAASGTRIAIGSIICRCRCSRR